MKQKLTQERLKELLDYDPETGIFTWKVDRGSNKIKGSHAGSLDKDSYLIISLYGKRYKAHRLVFLYIDGYTPENQVDHIDRNKLNNKRCNLREVSQICNSRNCNIRVDNKIGITGVCWNKVKNKWVAQIQPYKKINLGCFDNILDAARARWNAEVKYNFPNCNTISASYMYLKDHGGL